MGQITTRKPAAARAGELDAGSPGVECAAHLPSIRVVRHARGQLPLSLPALAHRGPDRVDVAAAQPFNGEAGQVPQQVQLRQRAQRRCAFCSARIVSARRVMPV